ncbi:MAG: TetR/AcrR family transcriptional regulator [Prevotella sp.]|nr:TetR/AcrR family transcriptional regulator [Prevotella sp.]
MQEIKNSTAYKIALKEKILEHAMTMFINHGIRAVKMDDIANDLQISKRTLYELYINKEELLYEGIKVSMTRRAEELSKMVSGLDNVMDIIIEVFKRKVDEFKTTNPQFYTDLIRYPKVREYFTKDKDKSRMQMMEFMKRGIDEGYFRPNVNYELLGRILESQSTFVMSERLYLVYSMQDILYNMIFVFIRGICTQKGLEVLDAFADKYKDL